MYHNTRKKSVIGSNEDDLTGNDVLQLIACEDLPDININLIEDPIQSEGLLTSILQKLRSQNGKTDWSKVSTTSLYVHHLDCAESIAKSFYTKELDIISSVLSKITKRKAIFNRSANKYTKVNTISRLFGDGSVWFPPIVRKKLRRVKSL